MDIGQTSHGHHNTRLTAAQMSQIRDELNLLKASINDDGTIGPFVRANAYTRYKRMT
jgi:hypothetical protein